MAEKREKPFNTNKYLATAGPGRTIIRLKANQTLSSQGDLADCLYYLQTGHAKLTIVSKAGKEATDQLRSVPPALRRLRFVGCFGSIPRS
jgi:CRP/FNR family cyclic AMP-dependent transcriptional regulator